MSISQDWITNELEDTELEALHRSPSVEYSFYNAVRAGDMEAVNKNCEEDSFLHLIPAPLYARLQICIILWPEILPEK